MRPSTTLILAAIIFMLIVGVIATIVWWRLADIIFPGTSERTGQYIGRRKRNRRPPEKPQVITGFEGPVEPPAGPSGPSDPAAPADRPSNPPPVF